MIAGFRKTAKSLSHLAHQWESLPLVFDEVQSQSMTLGKLGHRGPC